MRHETRKIDPGPTGSPPANPGVATQIKDLTRCMVIVAIDGSPSNFSGKVQVKCSSTDSGDDNANDQWFDISGTITQAAAAAIPLDRIATSDLGGFSMPWTHVRFNATIMGTTPPKIFVAGFNERTH